MTELERLRRERGMSSCGLARLAGVTEGSIRKWERDGVANARFGLMARVARALGVPMEDLLPSGVAGGESDKEGFR